MEKMTVCYRNVFKSLLLIIALFIILTLPVFRMHRK